MSYGFKICIVGGTGEARHFGNRLLERGKRFSLTMTTCPIVKYDFPVIVSRIKSFEISAGRVIPVFSDISRSEAYDMILDFTHPHARLIDKAYEMLASEMLWSFQRIPVLDFNQTVEDYKKMADWVIDSGAKKVISFLGNVGLTKLKNELSENMHDIKIFSRSIKPNEGVIHVNFKPESMNKSDELENLINEIKPEIALLKDSGTEGGTAVKKSVLQKKGIPFIGLKMPQKKFGEIYTSENRMFEDLMRVYEVNGGMN